MENINIQCSCPKTDCERYGNCEECKDFHFSKGKKPHCLRKKHDARPYIIASMLLFVFALVWNGIVHLVILAEHNKSLEAIHRTDLADKMWLSLLVTLCICLLFTLSFSQWVKDGTAGQSISHSLFFAGLMFVVVDLNQYVLYAIPFKLILCWGFFGCLEFLLYGFIARKVFKRYSGSMLQSKEKMDEQ